MVRNLIWVRMMFWDEYELINCQRVEIEKGKIEIFEVEVFVDFFFCIYFIGWFVRLLFYI